MGRGRLHRWSGERVALGGRRGIGGAAAARESILKERETRGGGGEEGMRGGTREKREGRDGKSGHHVVGRAGPSRATGTHFYSVQRTPFWCVQRTPIFTDQNAPTVKGGNIPCRRNRTGDQAEQEHFDPQNFGSLIPLTARSIHAHAIKTGIILSSAHISNILINCYCKTGLSSDAHTLFDETPNRDIVSWNPILSMHAKADSINSAQELFDKIPQRASVSWTTMIVWVQSTGSVQRGCWYIFGNSQLDIAVKLFDEMPEKNIISWNAVIAGYSQNGSVSNAVLSMYARCGNVTFARRVFGKIRLRKQTVTWTFMVVALAQHGMAKDALDLFERNTQARSEA
ncbi:pentatricopeptide repeat-containing protein [Carex littledalei]|uniref:Pentatricopeptide repeat-containing protein n=1 Tax=Carex littledalei TaxID=544730 RepID=A0A833VYG5_9POAL|nr:pentatricopeptide repeat-containing protein [Carex littledalei]